MSEINFLYPKCLITVRRFMNDGHPDLKFSVNWIYKPWRVCAYCDITELEYILLRTKKDGVPALTRDHVDAEIKTLVNNMAWSCFRCNIVKNHTFNAEEMREIGQKYVRPVWLRIAEAKVANGTLNELVY